MTINIHRICTILLYFTRLLSCHSNHFAVLIFLVRFSIVTLVSLGIQINKLNPLHYGSLRCSLLGSGSCMPLIDPAYAWYVRKPPTIRRIISQSRLKISGSEIVELHQQTVSAFSETFLPRLLGIPFGSIPIKAFPNQRLLPEQLLMWRVSNCAVFYFCSCRCSLLQLICWYQQGTICCDIGPPPSHQQIIKIHWDIPRVGFDSHTDWDWPMDSR